MPVPFIDLKRLEPEFLERWTNAVREISENTAFIGGAQVQALEERLQRETGCKHAIACANGTDALQIALRACGVDRGDAVLVPDFTFWATFEAVINAGADPVTVDVNPSEHHMDLEFFRQALDEHKPKAAMLVHLFGWGSPHVAEMRKLCKERGVLLIEDGAQAYGAQYQNESIYQSAEISTISFYPAKVLGAAGDAGAVLTNSEDLAERARSIGNHGRTTHYSYAHVGWNSRMDALQAAYLNIGHDFLHQRLDSRRKSQAVYREAFANTSHECIAPPAEYVENGYLNLMVYTPEEREKLVAALKEKGIGFSIVYPEAMSEQIGAQGRLKAHVGGDQARTLGRSVVSLPLFPYMRDEELQEVIDVVKNSGVR